MGVPSEPDGGEMAPTELALNNIAASFEGVADEDRVVAAASVILGSFVLGGEIAAVGGFVVVEVVVPHLTRHEIRDRDGRMDDECGGEKGFSFYNF